MDQYYNPRATNTGNIYGKTVSQKKYTGAKTQRQEAVKKQSMPRQKRHHKKKIKLSVVSIALIAGIGAASVPAITTLANRANNIASSKEAIEIDASTQYFMENLEQNAVMQSVISSENAMKLQNVNNAIVTYKTLKYKSDKTLSEQEQYLEAYRTICNSKDLIIDTYEGIIKTKIAEPYGIKDASKIDIEDVSDAKNGVLHSPMITLPDGTKINSEGKILNSLASMDKTLKNEIIKLYDAKGIKIDLEGSKLEELPVDQLIQIYEDSKAFEKEYSISKDNKGNLSTNKTNEKENKVQAKEDEPEL